MNCNNYPIGSFAYVVDNSYIFDHATGMTENIALARTLVQVVSLPYSKEVKTLFGGMKEHEFVNVKSNGKIYGVLNNLVDKPLPPPIIDYISRI